MRAIQYEREHLGEIAYAATCLQNVFSCIKPVIDEVVFGRVCIFRFRAIKLGHSFFEPMFNRVEIQSNRPGRIVERFDCQSALMLPVTVTVGGEPIFQSRNTDVRQDLPPRFVQDR